MDYSKLMTYYALFLVLGSLVWYFFLKPDPPAAVPAGTKPPPKPLDYGLGTIGTATLTVGIVGLYMCVHDGLDGIQFLLSLLLVTLGGNFMLVGFAGRKNIIRHYLTTYRVARWVAVIGIVLLFARILIDSTQEWWPVQVRQVSVNGHTVWTVPTPNTGLYRADEVLGPLYADLQIVSNECPVFSPGTCRISTIQETKKQLVGKKVIDVPTDAAGMLAVRDGFNPPTVGYEFRRAASGTGYEMRSVPVKPGWIGPTEYHTLAALVNGGKRLELGDKEEEAGLVARQEVLEGKRIGFPEVSWPMLALLILLIAGGFAALSYANSIDPPPAKEKEKSHAKPAASGGH